MNEIVRYEPRHRIVLWDESELTVKSEHLPALEAELVRFETTFVRIGDALIHKNSIKGIFPATQVVSELERMLAGKSQTVKEKVRAEVKKREADRKKTSAVVIQNIIDAYEKQG